MKRAAKAPELGASRVLTLDHAALSNPAAALGEVRAELARRRAEQARGDFFSFFKYFAWPVLEPATPYVDNWHIHAICEHLEALHRGEITRLLINMPFRMLKSRIVSQAFPAWEWVTKPHIQYLTASYAKDVATRDAVDSRRIIESEAYVAAFGEAFRMTSDQNVKTRYENDKRGHRIVAATDTAGTGFGGNRIIIDDPLSAKEADSDVARKTSVEWYKGTASTRLNDQTKDAIIVVHQRLHSHDLSGYILAEEQEVPWCHLVLPMRYEPKYKVVSSLGFEDPRTEEGELLSPVRLPDDTVKQMEKTLGEYHTRSQLQQRPMKRDGSNLIKTEWFRRYKTPPAMAYRMIYADTAQKTKERNDYSVFECWGKGKADGNLYLLDLIRGKWEAPELKRRAKAFWAKHKAINGLEAGQLRKMRVEDKSSGTGLIQELKEEACIPIEGIERNKDKYTRCLDAVPAMEAGYVWVPEEAPWVSDLLAEADDFAADDSHAHDDQLDPMFDAISEMHSDTLSMWAKLGQS